LTLNFRERYDEYDGDGEQSSGRGRRDKFDKFDKFDDFEEADGGGRERGNKFGRNKFGNGNFNLFRNFVILNAC
jgi:hypothetical protein